ncbi:MAG TPA: hypothetical protein V6C85_12370 [Allocoleopsis sp.]
MMRSHIPHDATIETEEYAGHGDSYHHSLQVGYEVISQEPNNQHIYHV